MNNYRKKAKMVLILCSLFITLYFLTFIFNSVNFIQYTNENEQKFKENIYETPLSDEEDDIILDDLNFEDKLPRLSSLTLKNYDMIVGNPYSWIDATGGTELSFPPGGYSTQSLPFTFDFYNESYSTIYLGANGYLSFTDSEPSDYINDPIPSSYYRHTYLLAPFWDDLQLAYEGGGGTVYVQSFGTYWVAEWLNVEHFSGPVVGTFEIILYENGDIVFNYDYISYVGGGYTCGLNLGLDTSYYNVYSGLTASTNDFSLRFTRPNDYAPQLSAESVIPTTGSESTQFNFSAACTDQDNDPPSSINVTINGTSYPMSQVNPLDTNYSNGCIYQYITFLQPAAFNYTYSFECSDGKYFNSTITYDNLQVIHVNDYGPELLNPEVNPSIADNSTLFNFTVWYFDDDNNLPININITLNSTTTYLMLPVNPLDPNAMDGVLYYFNTTLDFGYYSFEINCSDGMFTNSTGWIIGPEVNPFHIDFTLFYDDFERASLGSDWTHIGGGSYGINTDTFQSPTRSAYHYSNSGEIQSRVFDLSSYLSANISYWVRQGDISLGSDDPERSEDFFVEYNNNLGSWIVLDQFFGSSPGATIYIRSHQLPADALHSNFQIRFRQYRGDGSNFDWWHFDDVRIDVLPELNLYLPANSTTIFTGFTNFTWTSLEPYFGAFNYTLQISNRLDFSEINFEELNIPETSDNTSILIDINLATDQYYWRIRPTYGPFYYTWSEVYTFNLILNNFTPNLTSEEVVPLSGSQLTVFNYTVIYSDQDNNPPIYVNVTINGTSYSMSQVNPLDTDYTDGCVFQYKTKLSPAAFNYTYSFFCYDGRYANYTILYDNLEVKEINLIAPNLINPEVNPSFADNSTLFNFTVWYYDIENNQLTIINITINDTGTFLMEKADPLDFNATDGILYYYNTTLTWGYYQYIINCSDGVFTNSTGWIIDPEVNPFYSDPSIPLLTPLNESLCFTSLFEFTWTSLELPSGAIVNYTLQISNSTDFSFIIFEKENIEELSGVSNLTKYIDYPSGLYYWRVCAIYEDYTSNWSNYYMFNLTYNENIPSLLSGAVVPTTGDQLTRFNFTVVYIDPDNNYPYSINVTINGTSYEMIKVNSADNNYTDGCVYQYLTYLAPSVFNYTYYFECYDGKYANFTISYNNLEVNESNFYAPYLLNPLVSHPIGSNSILFNYTVWYYDDDNKLPIFMNITINNTGTFEMEKANPLDFNATDGILYYYNTTLPWGFYKFQINCSDGVFTNSTGWIIGPESNPFYGLPIGEIIFEDDFEDLILGPEWTVEFGTAQFNSGYRNSGLYSLRLDADSALGTRVNSFFIDLSGYYSVNLSLWICEGSEPPDFGEDLHIYYYNDVGDWSLLDSFTGTTSPGTTYTPSYVLPADALHSNFRIRFHHTGGTMTNGDYFHIDDVIIYSIGSSINPLLPSNDSSIFTRFRNFAWTSLEAYFGSVNYTLQISNTSDFTFVNIEQTKILETPITTTVEINVNLSPDSYFWRVRANYGRFKSNWSDTFTFTLSRKPYVVIGDSGGGGGGGGGADEGVLIIILILAAIGVIGFVATIVVVKKKGTSKTSIKEKKPPKSDWYKKPHEKPPIESYRKEERSKPEEMKHVRICKGCGNLVSLKLNFCTRCGAQLEEKPSPLRNEVELSDFKLAIKDYIFNNLPPPKSPYSPEGVEELLKIVMIKNSISDGNFQQAMNLMINCLKNGVPEPSNSQIKAYILQLLDKNNSEINSALAMRFLEQRICKSCGQLNELTKKTCSNCGRFLL